MPWPEPLTLIRDCRAAPLFHRPRVSRWMARMSLCTAKSREGRLNRVAVAKTATSAPKWALAPRRSRNSRLAIVLLGV